jgi:hypothetical protein
LSLSSELRIRRRECRVGCGRPAVPYERECFDHVEAPEAARLRAERDSSSILNDEARYYTALGVLLEENVRGLIREWRGGLVVR